MPDENAKDPEQHDEHKDEKPMKRDESEEQERQTQRQDLDLDLDEDDDDETLDGQPQERP